MATTFQEFLSVHLLLWRQQASRRLDAKLNRQEVLLLCGDLDVCSPEKWDSKTMFGQHRMILQIRTNV